MSTNLFLYEQFFLKAQFTRIFNVFHQFNKTQFKDKELPNKKSGIYNSKQTVKNK